MTDNTSLALSIAFNKHLSSNLLPAFENMMPTQAIEKYVTEHLSSRGYPPNKSIAVSAGLHLSTIQINNIQTSQQAAI